VQWEQNDLHDKAVKADIESEAAIFKRILTQR
jgi:hypothetical protein